MGYGPAQHDAGDAGSGAAQPGSREAYYHAVHDGYEESAARGFCCLVTGLPPEVRSLDSPVQVERYRNGVGAAHIHGGGAAEGEPVLAHTGTGRWGQGGLRGVGFYSCCG